MTLLVLFLAACGSAAPAPSPPAPPPPAAEPAEQMLSRLDRAAGCDRGASVWCVATRGWASGTAPAIPDGAHPGISIALPQDQPDAELPRGLVYFSVMSVRDGKILVTDIPPQNAAEQKLLDAAARSVESALKTDAPRALLPKSLEDFLQQVPAKYPLVREASEWRFAGKARGRIRQVRGRWVVVEVPGEGPPGVMLSIFF